MKTNAQLLIIGTGGTIAGAGASPELSTRYEAAKVPIAALAGAVPGLADHARLSFAQPVQKGSYEIDATDWLAIRQAVLTGSRPSGASWLRRRAWPTRRSPAS